MSNDFYNHNDGVPATLTRGASTLIRSEFDQVQAGFDKLPTLVQTFGGSANYVVAGGSADAWTASVAPTVLTSYADGMALRVMFPVGNATTAPTLNLNALGAKLIVSEQGGTINPGDIAAGEIVTLIYNATYGKFQMTLGNSVASAQASAAIATTQAGIATTGGATATTQAGIATTQAGLATTAKTAAETARDAALAAARIYASTAAGLAATTNTQYFYIPSPGTDSSLDLYLNSAGSAVYQKSIPATSAVGPKVVRHRSDFVGSALSRAVIINEDSSYGNTSTLNEWDGIALRYIGPVETNLAQFFSASEKGLYLDAYLSALYQDDLSATPITASAQTVGSIHDLSPNANHLIMATAGTRPAYLQQGSLREIVFDGVGTYLQKASVDMTGITARTIVVSFKQRRVTPTGGIFTHGSGVTSAVGLLENLSASGALLVQAGDSGVRYQQQTSLFDPTVPNWRVVTITIDPSQAVQVNRIQIRVNGWPVDSSVYSSAGSIVAAIFGSGQYVLGQINGGNFSNMAFSAILDIGRLLSTAEIAAAEAKFMARNLDTITYGLTSFDDSGPVIDEDTYPQTSAFASVTYDTDATSVQISGYASQSFNTNFPTLSQIGVLINGAYNQQVSPGADGAFSVAATLPAGRKQVTIVNSPQNNAGTVKRGGAYVTGLVFNRVARRVTKSAAGRLVVYADSIAAANAVPVQQLAWTVQVRAARTGSTVIEANSANQLFIDAPTAAMQARLVGRFAAMAPDLIYLAIGTNDYGNITWSAANFGTAYAAVLDALHAALPNTTIYCQTPLLRTSEVANSFGNTLGDYRTQIATAVSARPTFCTLVDGTAILTTGDLGGDGIHPTTAGHTKYANYVKAIVGIVP